MVKEDPKTDDRTFGRGDAVTVANFNRSRVRTGLGFASVLCLSTLAAFPTLAASFACSSAKTFIEHAICDNASLSAKDDEVAKLYKAIRQGDQTGETLAAQRLWLTKRNSCATLECLTRSYDDRIAQLNESRPTVSDPADSDENESRLDTPAFKSCLDKAVATGDQLDCNSAEETRQDQLLNAAYQALMSATQDPSKKLELRDAERAWIERRKRECAQAAEDAGGGGAGSMEVLIHGGCYIAETESRTLYLRKLAQ